MNAINVRIRAEIDVSFIGYDRAYYFPQIYLVFRGYTSAGLATRFRTRTHARVIGDNVREKRSMSRCAGWIAPAFDVSHNKFRSNADCFCIDYRFQ